MDVLHIGNAKVVKLIERVDSLTCREVEATVQNLIAAGCRRLICDFAASKYISSAGLRVFLSAAKSLKKAGGQLGIACAKNSYPFEVLETAGFTHIIPIFETVEEAVTGLARAPQETTPSNGQSANKA